MILKIHVRKERDISLTYLWLKKKLKQVIYLNNNTNQVKSK